MTDAGGGRAMNDRRRWFHPSSLLAWMEAAGLNLLYPPRCVNCGAELAENHGHLLLCAACCQSLAPPADICCRRCGAIGPVDNTGEEPAEGCRLCGKTRLQFDAVVSLGLYRGRLADAVLRMKRPVGETLALAMGRMLAERRRQQLADLNVDLIVPVPMHWSRRLGRGANSPEVLAQSCAVNCTCPSVRCWRGDVTRLNKKSCCPRPALPMCAGRFGCGTGVVWPAGEFCWSTTCSPPGRLAAPRPPS
jgi:predicted amidophosphoribosyltransferase